MIKKYICYWSENMILKVGLLDEKVINRILIRIFYEIIERNKGVDDIVLIGVKIRGYFLV